MRSIVATAVITAALLTGACTSTRDRMINPGFQHFRITLEQDGAVKDIENHSVVLEKKPFTILVSFTGPDSIFANASFDPESYDAAMKGAGVYDIPGFSDPGIDEEPFNKDEALFISKTSPNFWNYASVNEHRFSDVTEKAGVLLCRRTISNILYPDSSKSKLEIADLKENELYLVFMKLEWNNDFSKKIEIKREFIKIIFKKSGDKKPDISSILDNSFDIGHPGKAN